MKTKKNSLVLLLTTLVGVLIGFRSEAINLTPFHSDGCSASLDSIFGKSFVHCCIAHDLDYWLGGTKQQKETADENLKQCMNETLPEVIGALYKIGVELGGAPNILGLIKNPAYWVWGYGWDTKLAYKKVPKEQLFKSLRDLEKLYSSLDDQERALQKGLFTGRFDGDLKISHEQFQFIRKNLENKINDIYQKLQE